MTRAVPREAMDMIRDCADLEVWEGPDAVPKEVLYEKVKGLDGLYCLLTDPVDAELLDQARRLHVVSTMSVGFNHIDVPACTRRGIPVGYTPGVLTETTADFAFTLLMTAARRVVEGAAYVKDGHWRTWSPTLFLGQDIHGATLGIVGFGRIGRAVAKRAEGFGMRVLVTHHKPLGVNDSGPVPIEQTDFGILLAESDFVTLHVPLTKETHHLIGLRELKRMKTTAILINTSRGAVVDGRALYEALVDRDIAYAALDVTEPEPIPPHDPLLTLPNCLIVPHLASASVATRTRMAVMAAENVIAGLRRHRLPHCVNPEVYDQKP